MHRAILALSLCLAGCHILLPYSSTDRGSSDRTIVPPDITSVDEALPRADATAVDAMRRDTVLWRDLPAPKPDLPVPKPDLPVPKLDSPAALCAPPAGASPLYAAAALKNHSWTHSAPAGTLLLVHLVIDGAAATVKVTYGTKPLTSHCLYLDTATNLSVAIHSLPSAPANGTVLIELDQPRPLTGLTTSWSNAKVHTGCVSSSGATANPTLTGTSGLACRAVDLVATRSTTPLKAGPAQTIVAPPLSLGGLQAAVSQRELSPGSWTMTWGTGAAGWVIAVATLQSGP